MGNESTRIPWFKRLIGDKKFYLMVLGIAVPIMVQNGITNFVSLLDNIMIGRTGTEQMSGAAIVNQLIFVYNLCIFGAVSGAGIFTAQYFGQGDNEGIRNTIRFKLYEGVVLTIAAFLIFTLGGERLIRYYLNDSGSTARAAQTLMYARQYLTIMLAGLPPFMVSSAYASTLRECGETVVPMRAGIAAVLVNLVFNYLLIYGKAGFPEMGVRGAAAATVLSRYVEVLIILTWTHSHKKKNTFAEGLYKQFSIPGNQLKKYIIKGMPLLINETLWGASVAMLVQCYSVRGLEVVAGMNISNTINNVFNIVFIALGDTVAIVVGQLLGAGKMDEAKETDAKMIAFSVFACTLISMVMLLAAPHFPELYNTNAEAKYLAKWFIILTALFMPQNAFLHAAYFTLRSGGKTIITFFFDSVFAWVVSVSLAYILSRFTSLPVILIFAVVKAADFIKVVIGFILVKKGVWIQNIVSEKNRGTGSP